jgi:nucleotide-binding universal stress UspA family protein
MPLAAETVVQMPGEPARDTLAELSRHAQLFVVGCDDVGPAGALLVGSATMTLTMQSACSVVAWRGESVVGDDRPIVVGVDEVGAAAVLPQAFEFAHRFNAPLTVVRAWSPSHGPGDVIIPFLIDWDAVQNEQDRSLQTTLAPWVKRDRNVQVATVVEQAKPGRLLARHAADAQLVIVGRSHRGLVTGAAGFHRP